jgi:hypothetical protein
MVNMAGLDNVRVREDILVSFMGEGKCHASMKPKEPGARFFSEVSRCSIIRTELDEPFKGIALYELYDTDIRPLDVSMIPPGAWPYPNCLFVSTARPAVADIFY